MEFIQIGDNALKVSLTREDMEFYDIEFDMLDYKNSETRRALCNILDEAKRSFGFEASADTLYIEAFRSRCGGCELFVSKDKKENKLKKPRLFKFDSIELLLCGCARLYNCIGNIESSAYSTNSGAFYLVLQTDDKYDYIKEIAHEVNYLSEYIAEHTSLICHNAVATLGVLK